MVHFAPVYNFGSKEIVAWSTPTSPSMYQQTALLDRLLERMPEDATPVLHGDSEFTNSDIDDLLEAFDIRRSLSRKGNSYDNAAIESTNRILKKELVYRRAFADLGQLRRELNSYVRWRNEERMHSTLGYMTPVEFRNAGLSL